MTSTTSNAFNRHNRSSLSPLRIRRHHNVALANGRSASSSSLMDDMIEIERRQQRRQLEQQQRQASDTPTRQRGESKGQLLSANSDTTTTTTTAEEQQMPGAFSVHQSKRNSGGTTTATRRSSVSNVSWVSPSPSSASNRFAGLRNMGVGAGSRRNLHADTSQVQRRSSMSQLLGFQQQTYNQPPPLRFRESAQSFSTNSSEFMAVAVPAVLVVDDSTHNGDDDTQAQEEKRKKHQAALEEQEAQLKAMQEEQEQQRLSLASKRHPHDNSHNNNNNHHQSAQIDHTRRMPRRHTMHSLNASDHLSLLGDDSSFQSIPPFRGSSIDISAASSANLIVAAVPEETYERQELGPGPMRFAPQNNYRRFSSANIVGLDENMLDSLQTLERRWSKRYKKYEHMMQQYATSSSSSRTKSRRPSLISPSPISKQQQSGSSSGMPVEVPELSSQWHMRFLWFYAQPQKHHPHTHFNGHHDQIDHYHPNNTKNNIPLSYTFPMDKIWRAEKKLKARFVNLNVATLGPQLYSKTLFPVPGLKTKGGHDMFYMRPSRYFPTCTPTKTIIDNLVYVMNTMLENSHFAQKEGIGFVACMDGWKMKNFEVNYCYQFMMALQGVMVPVRTQLFLIVNPPSWFGYIWKIMKPMLAPSFRKRVKICPESRIAKYLAPGYQEFLPDDMKTGQAKTDQMVVDFISYRQFVEQGQVHHGYNHNHTNNDVVHNNHVNNVANSHHTNGSGGSGDYNGQHYNSYFSQSQSTTGSSLGGGNSQDGDEVISVGDLSSLHDTTLTGSHSTGLYESTTSLMSTYNLEDYRNDYGNDDDHDDDDDDDGASIHCDIDDDLDEDDDDDDGAKTKPKSSRGRGFFRGLSFRGTKRGVSLGR